MPPKASDAPATAAAPAKATASARFSFGGGAPKCKTCAKSVYENEKIVYDQVVYHQECFKCKKCTNRIPLVNVAMIAGDLYCKPCFKKIFAEKGTYSSFGEKTVPKWTAEEAKKRGSVDGPAPTTSPPAKSAGAGASGSVSTISEEPHKEEAKATSAADTPAAAHDDTKASVTAEASAEVTSPTSTASEVSSPSAAEPSSAEPVSSPSSSETAATPTSDAPASDAPASDAPAAAVEVAAEVSVAL